MLTKNVHTPAYLILSYAINYFTFIIATDIASDQERLWRETLVECPTVEAETRRGGLTPTNVDPKLYHDIQASWEGKTANKQ